MMLVIFDDDISSAISSADSRDDAAAAVRICCQQAYEGNHIIFGSRAVFNGILANSELFDPRTVAILKRSAEKITQRKGLREFVTRAIVVTGEQKADEITRRVCPHREEIIIRFDQIANCSSLLLKPVLMVENVHDGEMYLRLVKGLVEQSHVADLNWLSKVELRCDVAPGGGRTIDQLYNLYKSQRERSGIAIADGDYRYPGSNYGQTARALKRAESEGEASPLLETFVVPVRTIENMIPRALIQNIANVIDVAQGRIARKQIEVLGSTGFWHVLPIKAGVKCFDLWGATEESNFWCSLLGSTRCKLPCVSKQQCNNYIMPPLSGKLLERCAKEDGVLTIEGACWVGMISIWRNIIVLFFSLFCGSERMRLI